MSTQGWNPFDELTAEQEKQLDAFEEQLLRFNQRVNLISSESERQFRTQHLLHCLTLTVRDFPDGCTIVDWGTGGGLPAIPLAICFPEVTVVGEDHKLQAEQLKATLDNLGHDTDRLSTVHYSWVNLPEGGMSTREGTGIDLDDLLDEAISRAREEVEDRVGDRIRNDDLDEDDIERIAHEVGIGAVRYDIVSKQPTKGITFEWERALDFEAQSAPYVQYVHARACGILDEARAAGHDVPEGDAVDADALVEPEAEDLLRTIARFPAVIEEAADELKPHVVATYTRAFAEDFNAFYRECPVLDAPAETRAARLALVAAARTTVANALDALGVAAPDSM